ncbi:MAG: hypothetical protein AABZ14_06260, partial [Candidatus Margulisiibacteriota bacterium]
STVAGVGRYAKFLGAGVVIGDQVWQISAQIKLLNQALRNEVYINLRWTDELQNFIDKHQWKYRYDGASESLVVVGQIELSEYQELFKIYASPEDRKELARTDVESHIDQDQRIREAQIRNTFTAGGGFAIRSALGMVDFVAGLVGHKTDFDGMWGEWLNQSARYWSTAYLTHEKNPIDRLDQQIRESKLIQHEVKKDEAMFKHQSAAKVIKLES